MKKKILCLVFGLLATMVARADAEFPRVSDGSSEYWYYIEMQRGKTVLTVSANFANITTAAIDPNSKEKQLWKITQNADRSYCITSKFVVDGANLKLLYKGGTARFRSRRNQVDADEYKDFEIVPSTYSGSENLEGYEILVKGLNASEDKNYLNQNGGYGAGRELGCWKPGDPNNVLKFVLAESVADPDQKPGNVTEVGYTGVSSWTPPHKHTLWYERPAENWMTASLPIGNGQFGGTVMGGIAREEVQFNDKTLWTGHLNGLNPNASFGCYLNFGNLYITSTNITSAVTNYRRWLDIEDACAGVAFTHNGVHYEREYIASYPDDVIAIRYTASQAGKISTSIVLFNQNGGVPTYSLDGAAAVATFSGTVARTSAIGTVDPESYYCQARVVARGGSVTASSAGITVTDADEMVVYLRGMTNFSTENDDYIYDATLLPGKVQRCVQAAQTKGYDAIKTDHIADYKALYDRCRLTLSDAGNTKPTGTLISDFASNASNNLLLEELYFSYGRYLLISSSRGVALPANLQGIWNDRNNPDWHSDIHSDINVQMNYWPAEITNLSELHSALTEYIYREACERSQWSRNAQSDGVGGWTLSTENNIYGGGSTFAWNGLNNKNTKAANAWYCMHMWQHYRYTLDLDFLRNKAWPAMKSCCDYWLGRLVLVNGKYECPDEWSPEHGPMENATAYSQQLVWDLFNNTLKAYEIINDNSIVEGSFLADLRNKFENLDEGTGIEEVNGETLLREWKYTSQKNVSTYKSHRHMSHLVGLHPGNQIDAEIDPAIYAAAKQSVISRGIEGTGWSMGWKINLNARIGDAAKCHTIIKNALKLTNQTGQQMSGGGIYKNLWDAHPPFQIDGNFGACAGMAEMLMQSHTEKIKILPALPAEWAHGEVKGLRAVNKFEVDIAWKNNKADIIRIKSEAGKKAVVKYPGITSYCVVKESDGTPVIYDEVSDDEIEFPTEVDETYILRKGVLVTIGATGCGTLYYGDKNLLVPADINVATYTVKGSQLSKSHIYDEATAIPSATGVVLNGEPSVYTFFETDVEGYVDAGNMLRGVDEPGVTTVGGGNDGDYKFYKLTTQNGINVGFYYGAPDGAPFQMTTAHKAYLAVPKEVAAGVKQFVLDDFTTSIEEPDSRFNSSSATIYDLQGRKFSANAVSELKKGVYVLSSGKFGQSKKIVVK